jgi:hypothetical protein
MFSKQSAFFSVVLIAVSQVCVFSVEQTKPASPDTNSATSKGLEEVKTSIESLRLKIKNIKDSVDTAISEAKERHARRNEDVIANDPEVLIAERKVEFVREVLEHFKKYPMPKWRDIWVYKKYNIDTGDVEWRAETNHEDKTVKVSKYQDDGSLLEFTSPYSLGPDTLRRAKQEAQNIKTELARPQVEELRELTVVQNSIGALYQPLARIRKMLDVNSVNFKQVKQEIKNLDKKITDAEITTPNELQRISKKYQANNVTKEESDANNMVDEDDI